MGITKQDLVKISAALTLQRLEPSECSLLYLVMGDLGVSSEKLKKIKGSSRQLNDSEQLSLLLQNWVDATGDGTASLDDLISAVASNMERFPGLAKQDFVKSLNQIRKEMGSENDSVLSPMEIVFNSVDLIRAEIYKYLSKFDKACLRLTSKSIWNSTLSNWRKTVSLRIGSAEGVAALSMVEFHEIYLKQEKGEGTYELGNLIEYPFTKYTLYSQTVSPFRETWTEGELHFWTRCAPHTTSLNLTLCTFYNFSMVATYIWLVTKACPKIEKLDIYRPEECAYQVQEKYANKGADGAEEWGMTEDEDNVKDDPFSYRRILKCVTGKENRTFCEAPQGIANNLKFLSLHDCCGRSFAVESNLFLDVAPNLERLWTDPVYLRGIRTCSDRAECKLNDIRIYGKDGTSMKSEDFTALLAYAKAYPDVVKHIMIRSGKYTDWTGNIFASPIYQTILQCSMALVTLDLNFMITKDDEDVEMIWFDQLLTIEFPSLKKLNLYFSNASDIVYFDFATLLKTPNLRTLSIGYSFVDEVFTRLEGNMDWIQNEDSLEGNLLRLDKLEELCFDGWPMTNEDLTLFRAWFPSLKHLKLRLDDDISPNQVLTLFRDLKSLVLTTRERPGVDTDKVIIAKILHPKVRIFTEFVDFGTLEAVNDDKAQMNVTFKPAELNETMDVAMEVLRGQSLK